MKRMLACVAAMGIAGMMVLSAAAEDAYIQTDGTQAVNTGYHVTSTTKVVMDCALMDNTTKQQRPFGVRGDATNGFSRTAIGTRSTPPPTAASSILLRSGNV